MTQPVSHGYPDYGRFQAYSDKLLDFTANETIDGLQVRSRRFVGDVPYIGLNLLAIVNNFEFQTYFYDSQTGGALLGTQSIGVNQGSRAEFAVPVGGPWFEMRVAPVNVGSEFTYVSYTAHSSLRLFTGNAQTASLLSNLGTVVGAGVTNTVTTTRIAPGEAHWFATFSSGASYRIRLLTIDAFGSRRLIDLVDNTSPAMSRRVFLPACNIQIESFNGDGVDRQLLYALVTRPIASGW